MPRDLNPFDSPAADQLAAWALRLGSHETLGYALLTDQHLFALWYAACASAVPPPESLRAQPTAVALPEASGDLLATIKELSRALGEEASGRFANLYLEGRAVIAANPDRDVLHEKLDTWRAVAETTAAKWSSAQEDNLHRLATLLDLSDDEQHLLLFQLNRYSPGFKHLFDILLRAPEVAVFIMPLMLGITPSRWYTIINEDAPLVRSGLLVIHEHPFIIETPSLHIQSALALPADTDEEFITRFVRPLAPKPSTASMARLDERDESVLLRLMELPVPDNGLHVLIYGPRSVDKNDMLSRIFDREHIAAYAVQTKDVPATDIPAWVHVAQRHLLKNDPRAVLVVDRAEQALATRRVSMLSMFGIGEEADPDDEGRASDEGLTSAPIRCVWLTDRPRSLSEKNLGRFLFHCEARPGSRADRRERIGQVVADAGLSADLEAHLAKYSLLAERPVRQAALLADLLHGPGDVEAKEETIRRAVLQSQRVLGRDNVEDLRDSVTHYDLDLLNLSSRFSPAQIVSSLKKKQKGSLLFHGIPGAGKTQFAEYLAVELDKPLLNKRASDILSKWVGESEQNIASMFQEAEAEGAILFIDEADSFLRDRSLARAEWSVTQVNELLQHLERADGVVICATNLMHDIDPAAMRRFTFKIEFLALKPAQAWRMFCVESGFDPDANPDDATTLESRLIQIPDLAPGDFATVKRMSLILDDDQPMTPDAWLEQLQSEAKVKMHGLKRQTLGFSGH